MKVLIPLHGFINWNGGLDLIRLLSHVLKDTESHDGVEIVYAVPKYSYFYLFLRALKRAIDKKTFRIKLNDNNDLLLSKIAMEIIANNDWNQCGHKGSDIAKLAKQVNADIIFPTMIPIKKCNAVKIGYIFDFQHKHLPELFSRRTIQLRNQQFANLTKHSDALIVNSEFVRGDVIKYLAFSESRIFKLPFIPFKNAEVDIDISNAIKKYNVNSPYLIICNHFWVHKDHRTAILAFNILVNQDRFSNLKLVLTGDPVDQRKPEHFLELVSLVNSLGIKDRVLFLGLIPKSDQISLLCGAELLIQPTLYEGGPGGGSVYEAIGQGISTILSDIKINQEIAYPNIFYFKCGNKIDLAETIASVLDDSKCKFQQISGHYEISAARTELKYFMNSIIGKKRNEA